MMAMAIGAAVRVVMVSSAFGGGQGVKLSGPSESSWSFGQLLALLILILPFISALEIFRGETSWSLVAEYIANICDLGEIGVSAEQISDDQLPLNGGELQPLDKRYYYQPNPFAGGTTKAFRR